MMSTADIFSQHFLGIDYAEITDRNNRASIDDLLRTGETDVQVAMKAKAARVKAMREGTPGNNPTVPTIALTPDQEVEAEELARTIYKDELCALCSARQAVIRREVLARQWG